MAYTRSKMNLKQKLDLLSGTYTSKSVDDDREEITILNDKSPLYQDMKTIQFELNKETGTFELDYKIMDSASCIVGEIEADDLERADLYEVSQGSASVYTATRLGYMNIQNEGEMSDILKEFDCSIAEACAIWYDNQVVKACEMIRSSLLDNQ